MAKDKFGPYIQKLMTTILDKEQEEFVRDLAFSELKRLNVNIKEILLKHNSEEELEKEKEKQLLQEDKKNVTNK
tara:strand:- start:104 stop:325 length:222 start_codon:yes stop_codon:yes gene_type:complete